MSVCASPAVPPPARGAPSASRLETSWNVVVFCAFGPIDASHWLRFASDSRKSTGNAAEVKIDFDERAQSGMGGNVVEALHEEARALLVAAMESADGVNVLPP